nr:MAG TPA: hypothetical protein [Caudoviricetes sp.]
MHAAKVIAHKAFVGSNPIAAILSLTERNTVEAGNGNSLTSEGTIC